MKTALLAGQQPSSVKAPILLGNERLMTNADPHSFQKLSLRQCRDEALQNTGQGREEYTTDR